MSHRGGLIGSHSLPVKDDHGQKGVLRILLRILDWRPAEDASPLGFYDGFEMSLLCHGGDKDGVVARVAEVFCDSHCVRGRSSRALLMEYSTSDEKGLEPRIPTLDSTVRTRKHLEAKAQTKQGDEETRTSFHHLYI